MALANVEIDGTVHSVDVHKCIRCGCWTDYSQTVTPGGLPLCRICVDFEAELLAYVTTKQRFNAVKAIVDGINSAALPTV